MDFQRSKRLSRGLEIILQDLNLVSGGQESLFKRVNRYFSGLKTVLQDENPIFCIMPPEERAARIENCMMHQPVLP